MGDTDSPPTRDRCHAKRVGGSRSIVLLPLRLQPRVERLLIRARLSSTCAAMYAFSVPDPAALAAPTQPGLDP